MHFESVSWPGQTVRAKVSFTIATGSAPSRNSSDANERPRVTVRPSVAKKSSVPQILRGPPPGSCGIVSTPGMRSSGAPKPSVIDERHRARGERRRTHARQRLDAPQRLAIRLGLTLTPRRAARVHVGFALDEYGQRALVIEADVGARRAPQASHEQAGADEEDDGEGDLSDHQARRAVSERDDEFPRDARSASAPVSAARLACSAGRKPANSAVMAAATR